MGAAVEYAGYPVSDGGDGGGPEVYWQFRESGYR